jgi:hypothetical protein
LIIFIQDIANYNEDLRDELMNNTERWTGEAKQEAEVLVEIRRKILESEIEFPEGMKEYATAYPIGILALVEMLIQDAELKQFKLDTLGKIADNYSTLIEQNPNEEVADKLADWFTQEINRPLK